MARYSVNQAGVSKARKLIDHGNYDTETDWSDGAPSASEGNKEIEAHGYDGYGEWHLGLEIGASEGTKERYGFPYGDFNKVFRAALIHAKQRATQNNHHDVARAAGELLDHLDAKAGKS